MGVIMDCLGKQNMTKVKLIAHAVTDEIKQNFSQISQLAENEGVEQDYSLIYSRSNCKVGTDLQLYKITKIWLDSAQLEDLQGTFECVQKLTLKTTYDFTEDSELILSKFPKVKKIKAITKEGKCSDLTAARLLFHKHGVEVVIMVEVGMIEEVPSFLNADLQYNSLHLIFTINLFFILIIIKIYI